MYSGNGVRPRLHRASFGCRGGGCCPCSSRSGGACPGSAFLVRCRILAKTSVRLMSRAGSARNGGSRQLQTVKEGKGQSTIFSPRSDKGVLHSVSVSCNVRSCVTSRSASFSPWRDVEVDGLSDSVNRVALKNLFSKFGNVEVSPGDANRDGLIYNIRVQSLSSRYCR